MRSTFLDIAARERGPTLSMSLNFSNTADMTHGAATSTRRPVLSGAILFTEPATALVATAPPKEWPTTAANGPNNSSACRTASTAPAMVSLRPPDWPCPGRSSETTL